MFSRLFQKPPVGRSARSRTLYFDYAAATPTDPKVMRVMKPYFTLHYGNAGSVHKEGEIAKQALETTRTRCAEALRVRSEEIIFTGNGTESNNLAVFGVVHALLASGKKLSDIHLITTPIEHPSVLECFRELERKGANVTYLPVLEDGLVSPQTLKDALRENTMLVSIMYVNNEVGTIEPIKDLGKVIQAFRKAKRKDDGFPYFHTDASQAPLYLDVSPDTLGVDLLTLDGQKIYGPKGVGLLYKRRSVSVKQIILGGNQEFGLRPGTENIPLIVGLGEALFRAIANREKENVRVTSIRDYCLSRLVASFSHVIVNGPSGSNITYRVANNVNVSFGNVETEFLVVALSQKGIACGTKSACLQDEGGPSYVLTAMGKSKETGSGLRLSFGTHTTIGHIDRFIEVLTSIMGSFDNLNKQ